MAAWSGSAAGASLANGAYTGIRPAKGSSLWPDSQTVRCGSRARAPDAGIITCCCATVRKARRLEGDIKVAGDKSVSHRVLIFSSIADGESRFRGLSGGADVKSTASCMRALGVEISDSTVRGVGVDGLVAAEGSLDCGNSGTTMRILAGLLAAQPFESELTGDESLSRRPMDRVAAPLRAVGARAAC